MAGKAEQDDQFKLVINGKTYVVPDADDMELEQVELLEASADKPIEDFSPADYRRKRTLRVLTYIVKSAEDPSFTMDDARAMKLSAFADADQAEAPAKRPTRAAEGG